MHKQTKSFGSMLEKIILHRFIKKTMSPIPSLKERKTLSISNQNAIHPIHQYSRMNHLYIILREQ